VNFQTGVMSLVDTKNSETRHVPMTESVEICFRRRMPEDKNDFIFKSRTGGKIKEVSHAFDRAVEALGFNANVNGQTAEGRFPQPQTYSPIMGSHERREFADPCRTCRA